MKNLAKRFVNKCRRKLCEKTDWYVKQKEIMFRVINQLEKCEISLDMPEHPIIDEMAVVNKNVILDNISMAEFPFIIYLLFLKYKKELKLVNVKNDALIRIGKDTIGRMSYLAVYIHFINIDGNKLHIEGNMSIPTVFKDRCTLGVKNNGIEMEYSLCDGGLDLKKGKNTYETRTVFSVDMKLTEDINNITFSNIIDDSECPYGRINSMRFAPVADCIDNQYARRGDWLLYIESSSLCVCRAIEENILKHEVAYQSTITEQYTQDSEFVNSLRNEYFERIKKKNKPIWLFMDRADRADDNAEAMFKYVHSYEEIDSYFVIRKDTNDYCRLKELGDIIELNSREHLLLAMMADYILSSQCNGVVENPFWDKAEYFRDLYHQAGIIFLQHGVTKDDLSGVFGKYNTNFTGLIVSSEEEKSSFIGNSYCYTDKEIWLTGMPRFDKLYHDERKYILIMPSWRKSLMQHVWDEDKKDMIWQVRDDFLDSEYVKRYSGLLSNEKLNNACKTYGYKLVFMPHALMEPYINNFTSNENCIYWNNEKSYRQAFAEGDLMVTDYSSVAFDFAYLDKPVIYYQFDKNNFFEEHTYKKGYFDYERDGFGEVVVDENCLVELITDYMKNNCSVKEVYLERITKFFKYRDGNCCKRVYEKLKNR